MTFKVKTKSSHMPTGTFPCVAQTNGPSVMARGLKPKFRSRSSQGLAPVQVHIFPIWTSKDKKPSFERFSTFTHRTPKKGPAILIMHKSRSGSEPKWGNRTEA
jgi:hypothetical protein